MSRQSRRSLWETQGESARSTCRRLGTTPLKRANNRRLRTQAPPRAFQKYRQDKQPRDETSESAKSSILVRKIDDSQHCLDCRVRVILNAARALPCPPDVSPPLNDRHLPPLQEGVRGFTRSFAARGAPCHVAAAVAMKTRQALPPALHAAFHSLSSPSLPRASRRCRPWESPLKRPLHEPPSRARRALSPLRSDAPRAGLRSEQRAFAAPAGHP